MLICIVSVGHLPFAESKQGRGLKVIQSPSLPVYLYAFYDIDLHLFAFQAQCFFK